MTRIKGQFLAWPLPLVFWPAQMTGSHGIQQTVKVLSKIDYQVAGSIPDSLGRSAMDKLKMRFLISMLLTLMLPASLALAQSDGNIPGIMKKCLDSQKRVTYTTGRCTAGQHLDKNFVPPAPIEDEPVASPLPVQTVHMGPAEAASQPLEQQQQQTQVIEAPPVPQEVYVPVDGWTSYPAPNNWRNPWGYRHSIWQGPPYRQPPATFSHHSSHPNHPVSRATHRTNAPMTGPKAGSWQYNNEGSSLYRRY